jgi:L-arabinokinase
VLTASAPGRLDVMGGIADYSGALVLQLPLDRVTTASLQRTQNRDIDIMSVRAGETHRLSFPLAILMTGVLSSPEALAAYFAKRKQERWGAYVVGVIHLCLTHAVALQHRPEHGFRLHIESDVPEGTGISSSAALEVACLAVVAACYDVKLSAEAIATFSQWAENHIVGAASGITDQMTSAAGQLDHLLRLRCQPATIEGQVAIPAGYRFFGIDSGIRHAVTGDDYGTIRAAAFMGYRILAAKEGFPVARDGKRVRVTDARWKGYLANIAPKDFTARLQQHLPERMLGADFIARYHGITDLVTAVDPARTYPVRMATAHPVFENARVEQFAALLGDLPREAGNAVEMGRLMYESHEGYSACGLGSKGTDRLVNMVADVGAERGLFGAKITGAGGGGTVAVFGRASAEPLVKEIAARYTHETRRVTELFARSGMGMAERGVREA